jgi:hypothetical protein
LLSWGNNIAEAITVTKEYKTIKIMVPIKLLEKAEKMFPKIYVSKNVIPETYMKNFQSLHLLISNSLLSIMYLVIYAMINKTVETNKNCIEETIDAIIWSGENKSAP